MIRVLPAPPPPDFDAKVRQPGLRAIAELVGGAPPRAAGRRHAQIAGSREEIPADKFPPYWSEAAGDLVEAYHRICSYLCLYIPGGTGAPSVDHMVPKSTRWDQVYEWGNYRLACALMNARKGAVSSVLDPFDVEDGWFALELVQFQVVQGERLADGVRPSVEATIERLRLNDDTCCAARAEFAEDYWEGAISVDYLTRHAPFVAVELRRQRRLRGEDR